VFSKICWRYNSDYIDSISTIHHSKQILEIYLQQRAIELTKELLPNGRETERLRKAAALKKRWMTLINNRMRANPVWTGRRYPVDI
jgi:hypothetical protein